MRRGFRFSYMLVTIYFHITRVFSSLCINWSNFSDTANHSLRKPFHGSSIQYMFLFISKFWYAIGSWKLCTDLWKDNLNWKKNLPSKYEAKRTLEMHDLLAICWKAWSVNSETMTCLRRDCCRPCYLNFGELYCYGYFSQPKEHLRGRAERFLCQTLSLERVSATLYKCTQIQWLPLMSLELEIICGWLGFPSALCSISIMREGAILCLYNPYPEKKFWKCCNDDQFVCLCLYPVQVVL